MIKKVKYKNEWFENITDQWGQKISFWYYGEVITVTLTELEDYK